MGRVPNPRPSDQYLPWPLRNQTMQTANEQAKLHLHMHRIYFEWETIPPLAHGRQFLFPNWFLVPERLQNAVYENVSWRCEFFATINCGQHLWIWRQWTHKWSRSWKNILSQAKWKKITFNIDHYHILLELFILLIKDTLFLPIS